MNKWNDIMRTKMHSEIEKKNIHKILNPID